MVTWSYALAAVGITGLWIAGSRRKLGWAIGVAVQVPWLIFAITYELWGFVISALAYGFVYGRNWWRWWRDEKRGDT